MSSIKCNFCTIRTEIYTSFLLDGEELARKVCTKEVHSIKLKRLHVHYSNVKHQDYLAPFDYENCAKTQMDKNKRLLIEEIANVTMY